MKIECERTFLTTESKTGLAENGQNKSRLKTLNL
jgi:hypothetical protein